MAKSQPVLAVLDDEPEMRKALRRLLTRKAKKPAVRKLVAVKDAKIVAIKKAS